MNIAEIEIELNDLVQQPFDAADFPYSLAEIYHAPKAAITKLRQGTQNKADMPGDLLWKGKFYYRAAENGAAAVTVDALAARKTTKTNKPRFIIATDGEEFSALDTKADETLHCKFTEMTDHFDFFLPLAGIDKYAAIEENPADIKAAGRLAKFHDEIIRQNPDWSTGEKRHALNLFMTRILFCMFAEDTGILKEGIFTKLISEWGGDTGGQLQFVLRQVFDFMNVAPEKRGDKPAHIKAFPYVNGGLFADQTEVPKFGKRAMRVLIEAAQLKWNEINPDIFGSMIQAVVDPEMRGDLGMHYTSVPNIMKVLQPLFLMSLEEEFEAAAGHREERSMLSKLLRRISKIRVFDPACGSGNFLIIAYRELRKLEMRIFHREDELSGGTISHRWESGVPLSNFYGIEYADFAAETAKLSLWIAEYQMNQQFKEVFGNAPPALPLKDGGHIHHGNALQLDWLQACPPPMKTVNKEKVFDLATVVAAHGTEEVIDEEVETYIVGNPPYLGRAQQTAGQKEDISHVFSKETKKFKKLDYVACWILKASEYSEKLFATFAFVTTNSVNQGEQVALLWPLVFSKGLEIGFAHQSFKWRNNASKNAAVICVVAGVRRKSLLPKLIFEGQHSRKVKNISPYLLDFDDTIIVSRTKPIAEVSTMTFGNQPIDNGHLILSTPEKDELLSEHPEARCLMRRYYGSQEFNKGIIRWCVWLKNQDLNEALRIPAIKERIEAVRAFRLKSDRKETQQQASTPHLFVYAPHVEADTIIVPSVSSEKRNYITAGLLAQDAIISNLAFGIYNAPVHLLGIICSRLHYMWGSAVGGRLKTDPRYSNSLVYNTFPFPMLSEVQKDTLEQCTWSMLAAREAHIGKTIAQLYDPEKMPDNLLAAHQALDDTLEKIYIGRPFKNDTERLEHLFKLNAQMTAEEKRVAKS